MTGLMNFTPELLNAALEKYIFRTKFIDKDKEYVLKQSKNIKYFHPEKTLEHLIENSEGRLDIYAPADELLKNLSTLVAFPNNAQFLGISGNRINFEDTFWIYNDAKKSKFMLKSDVPLCIYQNLKLSHDEVSILLLKAYANKLYQKMENKLEYVSEVIVQDMYDKASQAVNNWTSNSSHKYTANCYNFVEYTPEEVFSTLSKFYDAENDQEFLNELQEQLKITAKKLPVKSNMEYYKNLLLKFHHLEQFMQHAQSQFMHIFLPKPRIDKNFPHFPVIRVFEHNLKKYVFVKDLEFALINYENVKIEVETEEERKNGIIRAVEYLEFENILKQGGISENDLNILPLSFKKTKHGVNVPILTSYETHCKLAGDAFCEVFRIFSMDIQWFNTVAEKNYYKLIDWFNSLSDVFSDTLEQLYLIDVWKIDELKNQAYEQMKKLTRKPKYIPKNEIRNMTKEQMYEEVKKFGSNVPMDNECWKKSWIDEQVEKTMSKWDILEMYDDYCLFQFTLESRKIAKFLLNQSNRFVLKDDDPMFSTPHKSLINSNYLKNEKDIKQLPKFFNKLDAHRVGFLNEYVYSMSTITADCYYENDTCLKLALDKTIVDESVKSKIISLVYEAEIQKFEKERTSVFYLAESEFRNFCHETKTRFEEVMDSESEKLQETHFSLDQYSKKFHESVQEIIKDQKNVDELIKVGLKARRIFEECLERIRNFKDYCRENKERTIVMRIMSEIRIIDFDEWHMFSEEVLEAIEVVLENEGRLETMKDKIENWKKKWINGVTFSTITIQLFKTILDVVGLEPSKFLFMPDVQFFKNYIDLPLKMGYNAMKILSPDGREVYHQIQAQFLMFQYGVCDVVWNSDNKKAKSKHKIRVFDEMRKIGKGYTLAETVEQSVEMLKYSDAAQKTNITALHGKLHNDRLRIDEVRAIGKLLSSCKINKYGLEAYMSKSFLLVITLENFMKGNEDKELRTNIWKAFTVNVGFSFLENVKDFEKWQSTRFVNFADGMFATMKIVLTAKFKNESARDNYDAKELVQQHYLFDGKDPVGTTAKKKSGSQKKEKKSDSNEKMRDEEDLLLKLMSIIPKIVNSKSDKLFESIENMATKLMVDFIKQEHDEEEAAKLCKMLESKEGKKTKQSSLCDFLDFKTTAKLERLLTGKKGDGTEKKIKSRQEKVEEKDEEEGPKLVVKYVTETKTVENCENCRSIEKETIGFERKIASFEKEVEEYQRIIKQNKEDLGMLKSQISQNKLKFREEIQKHKGDVESREMKIEQLNQEIKEYREDSRIERENLYAEVRRSSRIVDENVRKMKTELENAKFHEKAKDRKIAEMTAEIRQLRTSLEIAEENREACEKELENAENRVKVLKSEDEGKEYCFEDVNFEEDHYPRSEVMREDFEEILKIDVHGILKKIGELSKSYGISNSEIIRFQRKYDMYIKILENELCWEAAELPEFPISLSMEFMQEFESCLKVDTEMKNPKFLEMAAEISELEITLEISEENRAACERALEEAENQVVFLQKQNEDAEIRMTILEKQIEEMAFCFEDVNSEEDLYMNPDMITGKYEEILKFDVHGILNKINQISENFGISNMEIVRFQRRYDMYIRILETELCSEASEFPDFPIPFSAEFMQEYEQCLKGNGMDYFEREEWSNCSFTPENSYFFDPNNGFYM